ncbi:hypothetical protein F4824DRAFT_252597 [Ustulina deusta]|nr:hypothetical protein F4824DRAFT_252597 [Ustulina deusta]
MADQDMRLRLVVRRNGLPELRLMWHVHLDSNPTISKLLEQLNNQVPLESDHWGLEDYVVELHDSDGVDFECLHYQSVRSVLKADDRVFIRSLDRDDHRRRRISGRHQISSDGRHLIDGIPFGRPHLKTTTGRPNIYIPPLKRARLAYTQQDGHDFDGDPETETDPPLLLANGEPHGDERAIIGDFGNRDSDSDDTDFLDNDVDLSSMSDSINGSCLEDGEEEEEEEDTGDEGEKDARENQEDEDLDQEARELALENAALEGHDRPKVQVMSLDILDKLTALRTAFPTAPIDLCEKVLFVSQGNVKTTYTVLSEGFNPQMSQEAVLAWKPGCSNPCRDLEQSRVQINSVSACGIASSPSTRKRKFQEQSPVDDSNNDEYESDNNSLWRKYDRAGFPPGTITSGKGLAHMAAISASFDNSKLNANNEATSVTLKAPVNEPIGEEEEDDTSSSGSSSDSNTSSDESDNASEEGSSSEHSSAQSSSADSDDSDWESSDDSNEEPSEEPRRMMPNDVHSPSSSASDTSDSSSGPEEYPSKVTRRSSLAARDDEPNKSSESSDDTSDSESTGTDSSSESEGETDNEPPSNEVITTKEANAAQTMAQPCLSSPKPTKTNPAPIPVPPGAGKESTKRRNARRRAAKLAKRKMQEHCVDDINATTTECIPIGDGDDKAIDNEAALFEAKRKALLDAIAAGGIEIGLSGAATLDHSLVEVDRVKRKRTEEEGTLSQHDVNGAVVEAVNKSPGDYQEESASQKRRRVDLGATRRLVFGALGFRKPKNKEDEDKLRDRLRTDAQQNAHRPVSPRPRPTTDEVLRVNDEQDPNAWKPKINYRAVECCEDNIELSPAPFPFQQRWDPQQQYPPASKRNKRGGQSKRAQRNQNHYYNDSHPDKKREHHRSDKLEDDGYDSIYDAEDDTTNGFDITLNYDDIESKSHDHGNDVTSKTSQTSQTTDLDDLPSLPKDVSALPILRPGEAQAGMVITWLKWTCSSATSWQPQLSRVAAIVVKVDAAALEVCLAKRDRHLDENEKRYDHRTGQRIYGRFEVPDLREEDEVDDDHDDAGVDEGYRNVPWAEMKDPRILQQPLNPTIEFDPNSPCLSFVGLDDETTLGTKDHAEPMAPLISNHQEPDRPTRPSDLDPVQITSEGNFPPGETPKSTGLPEERLGDSSVEPDVKTASHSISHHAGQATDLAMSDTSQISSPSRQLQETTSRAMSSNSPIRNWAAASSIELGESPRPDTSSSTPLPISSEPYLEEDLERGVITINPKAALIPAAIPSSVSSIHSGRQPDYAMGVDDHVLDPFDATDDIDHQGYDHEYNTSPSARSSLTPIATRQRVMSNHNDKTVEDKVTRSSPLASPNSGSLSSLSSLWCTAPTSHSTQSPSRVRDSSVVSKPNVSRLSRDTKYEDAMHRLEEQLDEDASSPTPAGSSIKVKREYSTQFRAGTPEAISPPPRRRPFTIPPNSQVIELSSDGEPTYAENYADDEIDGNYTPGPDSLPRGDGWVKKRRKARNRGARKRVV